MIVNAVLIVGLIGLSVMAGVCIGILQHIHPLNEDFAKLTKLMFVLATLGALVTAVGAVLSGR